MSWALFGMVWRGTAGGLHHWIWLGQRETRTGEKWIKQLCGSLNKPCVMSVRTCLGSNTLLPIWSRRPWTHTSQALPRYTSTCCQCTATVGSRAKAPSCFGVTCSTCAVSPACAGPCWSVRSSWCPSTRKLVSRRRVNLPSLWGPWPSQRWSISSEAWLTHDETADVKESHPIPSEGLCVQFLDGSRQ